MTWADAGKTPTQGNYFPTTAGTTGAGPWARKMPLEQRHRNLAASLQMRLEEVYLGMLRKTGGANRNEIGVPCRCVASIGVANGKIFDRTAFENVTCSRRRRWRASVGARTCVESKAGEAPTFVNGEFLWDPGFSREAIHAAMRHELARDGRCTVAELPKTELCRRTAAITADGKILGWFSGARGMGSASAWDRSIVADPRRADMKRDLKHAHQAIARFSGRSRPRFWPRRLAIGLRNHIPPPFMTFAYAVTP